MAGIYSNGHNIIALASCHHATLTPESDANITAAPFGFQVAHRVDQKSLPVHDDHYDLDAEIMIMVLWMIIMIMVMVMLTMMCDWVLPLLC